MVPAKSVNHLQELKAMENNVDLISVMIGKN